MSLGPIATQMEFEVQIVRTETGVKIKEEPKDDPIGKLLITEVVSITEESKSINDKEKDCCPLCQLECPDFESVRTHFRMSHSLYPRSSQKVKNKKSHKCDICSRRLANEFQLRVHRRVYHLRMNCKFCHFFTRIYERMERHQLKCNSAKYNKNNNKKEEEEKKNNRSNKENEEVRVIGVAKPKNNKKTFSCGICELGFQTRHGVKVHIVKAHGQFGFNDALILKFNDSPHSVEKKKQDLIPTKKNKKVKPMKELIRVTNLAEAKINNKTFSCGICELGFQTRHGIKVHISKAHGHFGFNDALILKCNDSPHSVEKKKQDLIPTKKIKKVKPVKEKILHFRCGTCDFATATAPKLIEHARLVHKIIQKPDWIKHKKETFYEINLNNENAKKKNNVIAAQLPEIIKVGTRDDNSMEQFKNRSNNGTKIQAPKTSFVKTELAYKCKSCDFMATTVTEVKLHQISKHSDNQLIPKSPPELEKNQPEEPCLLKGMVEDTKRALQSQLGNCMLK